MQRVGLLLSIVACNIACTLACWHSRVVMFGETKLPPIGGYSGIVAGETSKRKRVISPIGTAASIAVE